MRLLTLARDLRRRKARERQQFFVAEGVRAVEELLRSTIRVRGVLISPQLDETARGSALRTAIESHGVEVAALDERDFATAAGTDSPQGVLAIGEIPERPLATLTIPATARFLVLDGIQDPGNVGTMLRTAAAFDVDATFALPGTADLWGAKTVRAAMGAHFVHPALFITVAELLEFRARHGVVLWGADAAGDALEGITPPARLAIAVGNEANGLSVTLRDAADRLVALPLAARVESLNAAVAAGILMHQLRA